MSVQYVVAPGVAVVPQAATSWLVLREAERRVVRDGASAEVLRQIRAGDGDEDRLVDSLADNPFAMQPGVGLPQIKLVVTSRFLRDCWKYESLALRLVLQDLGCLYQTLSLTATALGLATCILGAVPAPHLARALGVKLFAEPPLGVLTLSASSQAGTSDG